MKKIVLIFLVVYATVGNTKVIISPIDAMKYSYGEDATISKKNHLLKKHQAKSIQKDAKVKLKSRIFKVFVAKKQSKTVGYGVLLNRKVRSKNAVVLYIIDTNSKLKSIEVIAFNEPMEYLPSKKWEEQFRDIETSKSLKISKDISTITGATMTARSITDGSRLAFAFYNEILK